MSFDAEAVVAALSVWDVIYPFDRYTNPSKHKMWVCVSRVNLWFLRISTLRYTPACVAISKANNPYLEHDSFFGCGGDLIASSEAELTDLLLRQKDSAKQGIIGVLHQAERASICDALRISEKLSPAQLRKILRELDAT